MVLKESRKPTHVKPIVLKITHNMCLRWLIQMKLTPPPLPSILTHHPTNKCYYRQIVARLETIGQRIGYIWHDSAE